MFTGSVCSHAREWFKSNANAFAGKDVICGCSGNFTIETVLSQVQNPPKSIFSNDVSLYSSALGAYYTDSEPLNLKIKSVPFEWLSDFLKGSESMAATIVVLLEMSQYNRQHKTAYHQRMLDLFVRYFSNFHSKALSRLRARKKMLRVDKYLACDVKGLVERKESDDIFLSFMPTYSGGYERLYKFLDSIFEWHDRPEYQIMDIEGKENLLQLMKEKGNYVHVDDVHRDFLNTVAIIEGGHNRPVFIYSDLQEVESEVYKRAKHNHKKPSVKILGPDEIIESDELTLVMFSSAEFAWFRDQYLSRAITPADPQWRFGVCLGGVLIGVIGWSRGYDGTSYYMMCDVALPSEKYKRLSKLVCMVANSREMLHVLRQQTGKFWGTFTTTAFTQKPVSMKYRGVLDFLGRNEKQGKLNYGGCFGGSFKKAVKKWRKMESKAT